MVDDIFDCVEVSGVLLLMVLFDGVIDLCNFGVIICLVEVFGVYGVVVEECCLVFLFLVVVKIVVGVIVYLFVVQIKNLFWFIDQFKVDGVWVYGVVGEVVQDVICIDFFGKVVFVIGVEGEGMC